MNHPKNPDTPPDSQSSTSSPLPDIDGLPSETTDRPETSVKADLGKRTLAFLVDSAIAMVLGVVPVIGGIVGAVYFVFRDGLDFDYMRHRSVGKHLMQLRVVRLNGEPMDLETSFRRNWIFGIGAVTAVLAWIPIIGWLVALMLLPVAVGIGLYEVYRVVSDKNGRRWGDSMGGTQVVEEA